MPSPGHKHHNPWGRGVGRRDPEKEKPLSGSFGKAAGGYQAQRLRSVNKKAFSRTRKKPPLINVKRSGETPGPPILCHSRTAKSPRIEQRYATLDAQKEYEVQGKNRHTSARCPESRDAKR